MAKYRGIRDIRLDNLSLKAKVRVEAYRQGDRWRCYNRSRSHERRSNLEARLGPRWQARVKSSRSAACQERWNRWQFAAAGDVDGFGEAKSSRHQATTDTDRNFGEFGTSRIGPASLQTFAHQRFACACAGHAGPRFGESFEATNPTGHHFTAQQQTALRKQVHVDFAVASTRRRFHADRDPSAVSAGTERECVESSEGDPDVDATADTRRRGKLGFISDSRTVGANRCGSSVIGVSTGARFEPGCGARRRRTI